MAERNSIDWEYRANQFSPRAWTPILRNPLDARVAIVAIWLNDRDAV